MTLSLPTFEVLAVNPADILAVFVLGYLSITTPLPPLPAGPVPFLPEPPPAVLLEALSALPVPKPLPPVALVTKLPVIADCKPTPPAGLSV